MTGYIPGECPACGSSHILPVVYGMPAASDHLEELPDVGVVVVVGQYRFVLGGCEPADENLCCEGCGHRWPDPLRNTGW